ncbi:uncharacterized protein LOC105278354 [Ooceraea biroi]|uniref:uncharacterized protein LOC105278354 n=1 Tax=Ooceraea biroi TaxID=2015173 RepID=UPI000F098D47|nr:uncharacterized protein LOC105278354 [Ooceraea biroi]
MYKYMSVYIRHLNSMIPAKYDRETDPVLCVDKWDLLDKIRQTLILSFKAAILQKQKRFTEIETNDIAGPLEDGMDILYKKVNKAESKLNDVIVLAICYCNMGVLRSCHETKEKLLLRKSHLKKSLELLNRKELDRRAILIVLRASLQLECVYRKLNEPEKFYPFSHKALALCHKYTKYGEKFPAPINILCVSLDIEPEGFYPNARVSFVALYRELLNRLKPVDVIVKFGSNLRDAYTLINIMQKFLMRQLVMVMTNPVKTGLAWVRAACELSKSFLRFRLSFTEAENCLASAQYMLELYNKKVDKAETSDRSKDFHDACYYELKASVASLWGEYGNRLLFLSKYNMTNVRPGRSIPIDKATKSISMSSTTPI